MTASETGILYVVATPIGNLEDVTPRALRTLREVGLIAAEDTRTTRKLLSHFDIRTQLTSYHEHSAPDKEEELLGALATEDVALVTEAGMPGISDPGARLVRKAAERGHRVVPIPGPSAVTAALAVAGLPADQFTFAGFLPRDSVERVTLIDSLASLTHTLVAFESPHRLPASLADLASVLGTRRVAVCRELTKMYEEVWRGDLSEAAAHFATVEPRGEFTLVIDGAPAAPSAAWTEDEVEVLLAEHIAQGAHARSAVKEVAELARWPKRDVYRVWIELKNRADDAT